MILSTLRARVAAATAVVAGALTVGLAFYSYIRVEHHLDKSMDRFLDHEVDEVMGELAAGKAPFDPFTVRDLDGAVLSTSESWPAGLPLLTGPARHRPLGERRTETIRLPGASVRVVQYHLRSEPRIVSTAVSREVLEEALENYAENLLVAVPLIVFLTSLLCWLMARVSLRPLDEVIHAAERIDIAGLSQRLPESGADEVRRLARVLNEMLGRIEDGVARIRRFTADAAHELRTPLSVIRAEIDVALGSDGEPEELQRVLARLQEEAAGLSQLTDDLLLMTRGSSAVRAEMGSADLSAIVNDVADDGRALARDRGLALDADVAEGIRLEGNARLLRRLVFNLVDNAVKFTEQGSVRLRLDRAGDAAVLTVTDTGIGIAPEDRARVFERFFRARRVQGNTRGSGLGLSIVEWIAHAHGASVEIASEPGQGTRVTLTFPPSGVRDA